MATTMEQAKAVQTTLAPELIKKRVGSSLRMDDDGNWFVNLICQEEFPAGTFPTEKDGVKIVPEFTGPISAL